MTIRVRFFALTKDVTGESATTLALAEGATVADAIELLVRRFPSLSPHVARLAVAVNLEYVPRTQVLLDGQELALIPPVSGG